MVSVPDSFNVLEFKNEDGALSVSAVPRNWMYSATKCHWPNVKTGIRKLIKNKTEPFTKPYKWVTYDCKILAEKIDNYDEARMIEKEKENLSDATSSMVDTDSEDEGVEEIQVKSIPLRINLSSNVLQGSPKKRTAAPVGESSSNPPIEKRVCLSENSDKSNPTQPKTLQDELKEFKNCWYSKAKEEREYFLAESAFLFRKEMKAMRAVLVLNKNSTDVPTPSCAISSTVLKTVQQILPISSDEAWAGLEEKLVSDSGFKKDFMDAVRTKKTLDVNETVRRVTSFIWTDEYLKGFNWEGRHKKGALKGNSKTDLIHGIMHQLFPSPLPTDNDIEAPFRSHVAHAGDRIRARIAANARAQVASTSRISAIFN